MSETVPEPLRLLESFVNSVDVEDDTDDLATLEAFRAWLTSHGRPTVGQAAGTDDLDLARELRDALRAELAAHATEPPAGRRDETLARIDAVAVGLPLRVRISAAGMTLEPAADGVRAVLGEVVAAMLLAGEDGTWRRLKICREETCQYAYYDWSKNGSKTWCSMRVCGNRNKTRAYRQRRIVGSARA